jgi:hypothetical protein
MDGIGLRLKNLLQKSQIDQNIAATPIKNFFLCPFFRFPSPYNMINTRRFVYMKYKENGSPNISSNITIK